MPSHRGNSADNALDIQRALMPAFVMHVLLGLGLVMFASFSLSAQTGAIYYVSTDGSDSNPGTMGAPWLTIQHAANSVSAGATVYVFGGIYNESVNFPASGMASAPISFESYPGQTAVIDGTGVSCCSSNPPSSGNETQGLINLVNLSYITLSGFEIRNYTTNKAAYTPAGVWITGSGTGVQLLNSLVHNITTKAEKTATLSGSLFTERRKFPSAIWRSAETKSMT